MLLPNRGVLSAAFCSRNLSSVDIWNLEVCHLRCVCVKNGKGMQSNTIMSIENFNEYNRKEQRPDIEMSAPRARSIYSI